MGIPGACPRTSHSRLCEDIERCDALGRLGRVQMVEARNGVDDAEEDSRFHPVVHKI